MKPLQGKIALVTGTGAPNGIGRATALKLAEQGAAVAVTDVADGSILEPLKSEIEAFGVEAHALTLDITDETQVGAGIDQVTETLGGPDILVNNAGTAVGARPFLELTSELWDQSYQVNLKGTANLCRAVIPGMITRGGGVIVNNASTGGLGAEAGFGAYTATKHGVIGLTKTIAAEFGAQGIRCNAVCPGYVMTDMHAAANARIAQREGLSDAEVAERRYGGVALRRAAEPREVAETIAYLAGPQASYVTGAALPVSGGTPVGL